uniref:Uncharacterized protein n=1 Tax=Rhipicephalus appendiculatus TaxID=34631 RepID=A0A131YAY6_RHIAP
MCQMVTLSNCITSSRADWRDNPGVPLGPYVNNTINLGVNWLPVKVDGTANSTTRLIMKCVSNSISDQPDTISKQLPTHHKIS